MSKFLKVVVVAFVLATLSTVAVAQEEDGSSAEADRATTFQAVEGAQAESVPGGTLLVAAYAAAFVFLFGYTVRLGAQHKANRKELERLAGVVDKAQE